MIVMVVDDTDSARDLAERILRFYGLHAIGAKSGPEALALLEQTIPDLIFLDIAMPEMDGLSVLAQLRQDPRWESIPVVMLTALNDEESLSQARRLGACEYLIKAAFTPLQMRDVVQRYARHE